MTKIHKISFFEPVKFGGSKHKVKLPSFINYINSIAFFVPNSKMFIEVQTYQSVLRNFIPIVDVSVNLFEQNNSILDFKLNNNEFKIVEEVPLGLPNYKIRNIFSFDNLKIPINKENIKNANTTVVFKNTPELVYYNSFIHFIEPNVEMYVEYE